MPSFPCLDRAHARAAREPARACREHNVRRTLGAAFAFVALGALVACEAPSAEGGDATTGDQELASAQVPGSEQTSTGEATASEDEGASRVVAPGDTGKTPADDEAPSPSLASELLAKMKSCTKVSKSPYAMNSGGNATVDVCGLTNAVYWHADLDVDCDGKSSTFCNSTTDPWYQSQTAATDSKGEYLDAAALPYVVVPGVSTRWSYKSSGIALGSVVAVIYDDKVEFGIVGDIGPTGAIGEASYAMAKKLGINPNPKTGGIGSGVSYLVFTGTSGVVKKKEDHAEAVSVGAARAKQFLTEN